MNKLQEIIAHKRTEIIPLLPKLEKLRVAALARNDFRSMEAALLLDETMLGVIAEVKKASPSVGVITEDFDPVAQAVAYDQGGASAISVLTDEKFFQGHLSYLTCIRQAVVGWCEVRGTSEIPLPRKSDVVPKSANEDTSPEIRRAKLR